MKKILKKQKLALHGEVVRNLSALDLRRVAGGAKSSLNYQEDCITTTSQNIFVCTSGYFTCHETF